jgi:Flp pilus assembly protein TadG
MKSQTGSAAVEMALVTPILLLILIGTAQFGWLFANFVAVSNAASSAARTFASQRGATTPYSTTLAQAKAAASFLKPAGITVSTMVDGVACVDDASCAADLAPASSAAVNMPVKVSVTYQSFQPIFTGTFFNLNGMMPAVLTASVSARVQ